MDEKTRELRDIFIEATGSDTATERQEDGHGSLAERGGGDNEADVEARVTALIAELREREEFRAALDDDALRTVVYGFFDGDDDTELAERLGVDAEAVVEARLSLHLVRERDHETPLELSRLRSLVANGAALDDCVAAFDADPEAVAAAYRVAETLVAKARVNDRFADAFAELLTDADLSTRLAEDARNDGLREATEDIETDVSL